DGVARPGWTARLPRPGGLAARRGADALDRFAPDRRDRAAVVPGDRAARGNPAGRPVHGGRLPSGGPMRMREVGLIAAREVREALRSRWFLLAAICLLLLSLGLSLLALSGAH